MATKPKKKFSAPSHLKNSRLSNRAHGFAIIREHHQREVVEDYLEAILDLSKEHGEVRVSELSHYFGVSMATVNQHIKRLMSLKYITSKPYRSIFLTDKGKAIALQSFKRHQLVIEFLVKIGVPAKTAHLEAEGLEHHFSNNTILCIERWIKKMEQY